MVICEVFLLVMAYVPTPSHGAPVGVAKATVHIFSNAMGRVTVTLVRPKEQFHTPHCCYKPMAIVRHSYFTLLPPLHAPSMPQDILVILSIVMDSYIAPLLRFHVPTTPKTLLNWIGYTQVLILRPVNPHCLKANSNS